MQEEQKNGRSIDHILASPLSGLRIAVADKFQHQGISAEDLQDLAQQLQQPAVTHDREEQEAVKKEFANIESALRTGKAPIAPDLEYPATQLLWGTALAHALSHPETPASWLPINRGASFTKSALWKQVTGTPYMKDELREHAFHISDSIRNPQAKIRWGTPPDGYPGVGFFYNPEDNLVNIDLLWSLIDGIEHSRAANLHEIGHSQLTAKFTPKMQAIREEMEALTKQKEENGKLKPEEYKRLAMLSMEWQLRHRVEVQPIEWLQDPSGVWLSRQALFSGVQFDRKQEYDGNFAKTDMKQYLDNYFSKEMLASRSLCQPTEINPTDESSARAMLAELGDQITREGLLKVGRDKKTVLRKVIEGGLIGEALTMLKAAGEKITKNDLITHEPGSPNSNIEQIASQGQLAIIFQPEYWTNNVREMQEVWARVPRRQQAQMDGQDGRSLFKQVLQQTNAASIKALQKEARVVGE